MTTFLFKSNNGIWDFGSELNYKRFIQHLRENNGKDFRIEPLVHTRTLSQNNLYHLFLDVIERETGQSATEVHEWAKRKFLQPREIVVNGDKIRIPGSTTELNKIEFSEYMEKIATMVGVAIPDTEKYLQEFNLAPIKWLTH